MLVSYDADGDGSNHGFVDIGTLSGAGTSITVALNASASNAAVAALSEAIRFSSSHPTVDTRTVNITLNDGDGTANGGHDFTRIEATVTVGPTLVVQTSNGYAVAAVPDSQRQRSRWRCVRDFRRGAWWHRAVLTRCSALSRCRDFMERCCCCPTGFQ